MAKELPYFKFEPSEWAFGRINKQNKDVKVAFIDLICKYWHNLCVMTLEDAILDFGKDEIDILIKTKIIKTEDNFVKVVFLDDQFEEISENTEKLSKAGKASARKRALKNEQISTRVEHPSTNNIRLNEIKKDEIKINNQHENVIDNLNNRSVKFQNSWKEWIDFRKEIKKPYKSQKSIEGQLKTLSNFDDDIACYMIQQSINNQWQGIFPLKNNNNLNKKNPAESTLDALNLSIQKLTNGTNNDEKPIN